MKIQKWTALKSRQQLPEKTKSSNKSNSGRALIWAGSEDYMGAGVLCAEACARSGVGYTYLMTNKLKFNHFKSPDLIVKDQKKILQCDLQPFQAIGVGSGLGLRQSAQIIKFLSRLKSESKDAVVLDADALNALSSLSNLKCAANWVLTPHEGELARLIGWTSKKIQKNPVAAVQLAQKKYGGIVLLKGSETYVTDGREVRLITSGHPALAKSGTGDVLTGLITGFMAQGISPFEAACNAAFVHGVASHLWIKNGKDELALLASDLLDLIPEALYAIRRNLDPKFFSRRSRKK